MLKQYYQKLIYVDNESKKMLALVKKFASVKSKILDVGCGYGRYLAPLHLAGYDILGVEQNPQIVKSNLAKGYQCISPDDVQSLESTFDVIILSHIIEHFTPPDLLIFLNGYLTKLNIGGFVIIATPLNSDYFFDDFDHVKPYHPEGLQMVFGGNQAQVQYYAEHRLVLRDLWFRKSPFMSIFQRAKYFTSAKSRLLQLYDLFMILFFKCSKGLLGRKDGWVGVFEKIEKTGT